MFRAGVNVPGVRYVDIKEGVLGIEWIDGHSVRKLLPDGAEEDDDDEDGNDGATITPRESHEDRLKAYGISVGTLSPPFCLVFQKVTNALVYLYRGTHAPHRC